jgi:hypothetical protein
MQEIMKDRDASVAKVIEVEKDRDALCLFSI